MSSTGSAPSDSSDARSIGIEDQLIGAIQAGELENVREILSQEILRAALTDDDIHEALCHAARSGSVEACRLLWKRLSRRGKRMYFGAKIFRFQRAPLHAAAGNGELEVVRLFIKEFKWNINQKDYWDKTPLYYAVRRLETARFLLENGANVNQGGEYGPLEWAVLNNNTEVSRLLLVEYHANPNLNRRPVDDEEDAISHRRYLRNTDYAIIHGNTEILRILLEHGAIVGHLIDTWNGTSLNNLLGNREKTRETKLTICRILIAHAQEDHATTEFMQASFGIAFKQTESEACQILLEAGIDRRMSMYCAIQVENLSICQLLVNVYQFDPFLQQENNENDDSDDETAASPFLAAAHLADTSIFEYFLGIWDARFSSSGGKNGNGDYPIHIVCCDPHVSLQAIQVLVNRHADALAMVDGEQELLPFHFAANWGASLDVIFYLLQHCPNALCHGVGKLLECPSTKVSRRVLVRRKPAAITRTSITKYKTMRLGDPSRRRPKRCTKSLLSDMK